MKRLVPLASLSGMLARLFLTIAAGLLLYRQQLYGWLLAGYIVLACAEVTMHYLLSWYQGYVRELKEVLDGHPR